MTQSTHEIFSREETVIGGSDRSFGFVMGAAFAAISLVNWWHDGRVWLWAAGAAFILFAAALLHPVVLNPLNRLWLRFGLLIHKVVNPIVMAFVFFGAVLPTGLIMRALGKDLLRLERHPDSDSYWIERRPPGPASKSMKDQF